jgi:DNA (cytosine-5)-methyltransferase 1
VPQHRMRLFIVGLRSGEEFIWPSPGARHTLRDAIGDLPAVPGGQREDCIPYHGRPTTALQRRLREAVPDEHLSLVFDHITRAVRPDDAEAFSLMKEGGTYDDLPAHLQRYRSDIFTDKYKRLEWDELSRSITAHIAKDGYWYIHPDQDRTLSIREAARIQTFPDWFRCAGTPSHRYLQTGNAVPPLLAEAIGRRLITALSNRRRRSTRRDVDTFRDRLLRWHDDHARPFQWRQGAADPWHVLMAELALPRMRSAEVPAVYRELIRAAPTPQSAVARHEDVAGVIRGLGLGVRAANILRVADAIIREHGGDVPATEASLSLLPEVGDYVANAVLCFGYGRRAVLLDRSTERIIGRIRGRENVHRWQLRLDLYDLAGRTGPDAAFNHALLDLGAHLCRPSRPLCDRCPLNRYCTGSMVSDRAATVPLALTF